MSWKCECIFYNLSFKTIQSVNTLGATIVRGNINMSFLHIDIEQVVDFFSSSKTNIYLFYTVDIKAVDDLATQGGRISATIIYCVEPD